MADVVKTAVQQVFIRYEHVKEHAKMHDVPAPAWVRAIDWPGTAAEALSDKLEALFKVGHATLL
jgi:hypothetical protein